MSAAYKFEISVAEIDKVYWVSFREIDPRGRTRHWQKYPTLQEAQEAACKLINSIDILWEEKANDICNEF